MATFIEPRKPRRWILPQRALEHRLDLRRQPRATPPDGLGSRRDGREVAYVDRMGLHVQTLEDGAVRSVPLRGLDPLRIVDVSFTPDGRRLVASEVQANGEPDLIRIDVGD